MSEKSDLWFIFQLIKSKSKSNLSNYLKLVLIVILGLHWDNESSPLLLMHLDILRLLLKDLLRKGRGCAFDTRNESMIILLERGLERQMLLVLSWWHIFSLTFRSGIFVEVRILLICTKGELLWTDSELVFLGSCSSLRCALTAELWRNLHHAVLVAFLIFIARDEALEEVRTWAGEVVIVTLCLVCLVARHVSSVGLVEESNLVSAQVVLERWQRMEQVICRDASSTPQTELTLSSNGSLRRRSRSGLPILRVSLLPKALVCICGGG